MANHRTEYDAWHQKKEGFAVAKHESGMCKKILSAMGAKKGASLLDVACGKGAFCAAAHAMGLQAQGTDFSDVALQEARRASPEVRFTSSDALKLPFKDTEFDYVTCLGSLEHFTDKKSALAQMRRVLKDRGKLYLLLPNSYFLGHIYMVCKTGMPPDEAGQQFSEDFNTSQGWKRMIEENGFRVTAMQKFNSVWGTQKVPLVVMYMYNYLVAPFLPFNLSYAFGYVCEKK